MKKLLLIGAAFAALIVPAIAAEKPVRVYKRPVVAAAPVSSWSGFYIGGAFSYGSATSDFSTATRPLVHFSLQHLTVEDQAQPSQFEVLGRGSAVAAGVGGFVGYNMQWQDLSRRSLDIAFVSEFRTECRGCVRVLCTRTCV